MSSIKKIVATMFGTLAIMSWMIFYAGPGLAVGKYTRGAFAFRYALLTEYIMKTSGWHLLFFGLAPFLIYGFLFCRSWLTNQNHYLLVKLLSIHILLGVGCAWLFSLDQN